jgi:hypothetical protein
MVIPFSSAARKTGTLARIGDCDRSPRMIANMRFNSYSREAVRRRFDKTPVRRTGGEFDQPVRIDCFGPGTQAWRCQ